MERSPLFVAARAGLAATLALGLAGCNAALLSNAFETGDAGAAPAPAGASIDPTYTVAPEERRTPARRAVDSDPQFDKLTERAAKLAMREGDVKAAVAHLSRLYEVRPTDRQVIFDYARHLRYVGAVTLAEQVLNDGLAAHPGDKLLRLERAKLLIGAGRPSEALAVLAPLREALPNDPSVLQAMGVAHDRRGEHAEAQKLYATAMTLGRPSAALLNNAGLSHLLSGDAATAVALLRRASTAPGANAQVRQNLALALTLKGDAAGAAAFAREGAPKRVSDATLATFRKIKSVDHPWSRAAGG